MKNKVISAISLLLSVTMLASGCSLMSGTTEESAAQKVLKSYDFSAMELVQLKKPDDGQLIAVIDTTLGSISVVLYPEYCPKTVANFVNRAKEGYYNNTSIFEIYTGYYFLAGSAKSDGSEGVTDDGNPIPNECSVNLWPFKGALLAYNDTVGFGDSRFFVCGSVDITEEELQSMRETAVDEDGKQIIPDTLLEAFVKEGSLPGFSCSYTVFGQTVEGMDVVDKILAVTTDEETKAKSEEVLIKTVEITEYKAQ